jgi:hypothetical protein
VSLPHSGGVERAYRNQKSADTYFFPHESADDLASSV